MPAHTDIVERDCARHLPGLLQDMGVTRVLLVTGGASFDQCGARGLFESLLSPFDVTVFNAFSPNIDLKKYSTVPLRSPSVTSSAT